MMNMKQKHSSSRLLSSVRKQSCHNSGALHPALAIAHAIVITYSVLPPWRSRNQTRNIA